MKTKSHANNFTHLQLLERFQLCARQWRSKPHGAVIVRRGLQQRQRQRLENTPCGEFLRPAGPVGVDLHPSLRPLNRVDNSLGLNVDIKRVQFPSENVHQIGVSVGRAESAIPFNRFLRSHPLHQPVNAHSIGIGCVEAANIGQRSFLRLLLLWAISRSLAAPLQKAQKRFIRRTVIHLLEDVVDFRKEIATRQPAFTEAPRFSTYFCNADAMSLQRRPDLRRQAMNKFSSKLDRSLVDRIAKREHPPANPVTRFKNADGKPVTSQLCSGGQSRRPCANHDDIGRFRHDSLFQKPWSKRSFDGRRSRSSSELLETPITFRSTSI